MRVILIGPRWEAGWTEYCLSALERLGHSVTLAYSNEPPSALGRFARRLRLAIGWRLPGSQRFLERTRGAAYKLAGGLNRNLLATFSGSPADLLLVLKGEWLFPETLATLKRSTGAKLASWWVDSPFEFSQTPEVLDNVRRALPLFDHFFISDRSYIPRLKEAGARAVHFLPCAVDPSIYRPITLSLADRARFGAPLVFAGTYYPNRLDALRPLLHRADIKVWGPGWGPHLRHSLRSPRSQYGGSLQPADVVKVFNAAQIVLNVHHPQSREAGLNMRAFEAAACGAFQLCDALPGSEELFAPGTELVTFDSSAQLAERVDYYLAHAEARARVAVAARKRALEEHTYEERMRKVIGSGLAADDIG